MRRTSDADIRLMDAALDLIWEERYGAVTIADICTRENVKKGSFYYFYKPKAKLAISALDRMWKDDWKPRMDTAFSPSTDLITTLPPRSAPLFRPTHNQPVNYFLSPPDGIQLSKPTQNRPRPPPAAPARRFQRPPRAGELQSPFTLPAPSLIAQRRHDAVGQP